MAPKALHQQSMIIGTGIEDGYHEEDSPTNSEGNDDDDHHHPKTIRFHENLVTEVIEIPPLSSLSPEVKEILFYNKSNYANYRRGVMMERIHTLVRDVMAEEIQDAISNGATIQDVEAMIPKTQEEILYKFQSITIANQKKQQMEQQQAQAQAGDPFSSSSTAVPAEEVTTTTLPPSPPPPLKEESVITDSDDDDGSDSDDDDDDDDDDWEATRMKMLQLVNGASNDDFQYIHDQEDEVEDGNDIDDDVNNDNAQADNDEVEEGEDDENDWELTRMRMWQSIDDSDADLNYHHDHDQDDDDEEDEQDTLTTMKKEDIMSDDDIYALFDIVPDDDEKEKMKHNSSSSSTSSATSSITKQQKKKESSNQTQKEKEDLSDDDIYALFGVLAGDDDGGNDDESNKNLKMTEEEEESKSKASHQSHKKNKKKKVDISDEDLYALFSLSCSSLPTTSDFGVVGSPLRSPSKRGYKKVFTTMGVPIDGPTNTFCDNDAVVKSVSNPESTLKKRHTSVAWHRTREALAAFIGRIAKEPGETNLADMLTKLMNGTKLKEIISRTLW